MQRDAQSKMEDEVLGTMQRTYSNEQKKFALRNLSPQVSQKSINLVNQGSDTFMTDLSFSENP